jgi:hypothetical protein
MAARLETKGLTLVGVSPSKLLGVSTIGNRAPAAPESSAGERRRAAYQNP